MLKHKKKTHDSENPAAGATEPAAASSPPSKNPPATPDPPSPSPAEIELAALKDKHLRLMADFDNFRKRQTREREEMWRHAVETISLELLPVLDHLELALSAARRAKDPLAVGVQLTLDQFLAVLGRFEVRPFDAAGQAFDPNRHEALCEEPSTEVAAHQVLLEVRRGYLLNGRLLRAAQAIVSSGPPAPAQPPAAPTSTPPAAPTADKTAT